MASTKGHVIDETIGWRSRQGDVHVYDPAAITPYYRSGWSLLADCATWQGAIRTAADLTLAARGAGVSRRPRARHRRRPRRPVAQLDGDGARPLPVGRGVERADRQRRGRVDRARGARGGPRHPARRRPHAPPARTRPRSCATTPPARPFLHAMHQILSVYDDPVVAVVDGPSRDRARGAARRRRQHPVPDHARTRPGAVPSAVLHDRAARDRHRLRAVGAARAPRSARRCSSCSTTSLGIAPIYDLASLASTAPAAGRPARQRLPGRRPDHHPLRRRRRPRHPEPRGQARARRAPRGPALRRRPRGHRAHRPAGRTGTRPCCTAPPGRPACACARGSGTASSSAGVRDPAGRGQAGRGRTRRRESRPSSDQASAWLRRSPSPVRPSAEDPTIPLDTHDPGYVEVFGSLDDDTAPQNVTPMPGLALAGRRAAEARVTSPSPTSNTAVTGRWSEMAAKRARSSRGGVWTSTNRTSGGPVHVVEPPGRRLGGAPPPAPPVRRPGVGTALGPPRLGVARPGRRVGWRQPHRPPVAQAGCGELAVDGAVGALVEVTGHDDGPGALGDDPEDRRGLDRPHPDLAVRA